MISNDTDLIPPIEVVRQDLGLEVGVLHPYEKKHSAALARAATFYRPITTGMLKASQFPPTLKDPHGAIVKPSTW